MTIYANIVNVRDLFCPRDIAQTTLRMRTDQCIGPGGGKCWWHVKQRYGIERYPIIQVHHAELRATYARRIL